MIRIVDGVLIIKLEKGEAQNSILPSLVSKMEKLAIENHELKLQMAEISDTALQTENKKLIKELESIKRDYVTVLNMFPN